MRWNMKKRAFYFEAQEVVFLVRKNYSGNLYYQWLDILCAFSNRNIYQHGPESHHDFVLDIPVYTWGTVMYRHSVNHL